MHGPKETIWPLEPHSVAKHKILRSYLDKWFPILSSAHNRVIYFDGFAGPGLYEGGEPGSPVIAIDTALRHAHKIKEIFFYFVEAHSKRCETLRSVVAAKPLPPHYKYEIHEEHFDQQLTKELDELDSNKDLIAPTFALIDPFGFSGVPLGVIHRLLAHPHTEVFINFMSSYISRFLHHPNEETVRHIVDMFGTNEVRGLAGAGANRIQELRTLYQAQLQMNGRAKFVRYFSMFDEKSQPIYDLFFATNNELGHEKMKMAMWEMDPEGTFRFSDATVPEQMVLFQEDVQNHTRKVRQMITARYEGHPQVEVREISSWITDETAYLPTHMRASLRQAEDRGDFRVEKTKSSGKKRVAGSFPDDVVIDFTRRGTAKSEQKSLF